MRKLQWTDEEIAISYRQAANQVEQLKILAELNACDKKEIVAALKRAGVEVKRTSYYLKKEKRDLRWELYEAGCNDQKIADSLGMTVVAIRTWRSRHGLASNRVYKKEQ